MTFREEHFRENRRKEKLEKKHCCLANGWQITKPRPLLKCVKPYPTLPLLWSTLDAKVREQQSVNAFKKLIRKQNLAALISTNDCENSVLCNS